ncbi:MAG: type II secretion system minor pseudopilin GspK, partial [Parasphingorhabdus sp.]
MSDSKHLVPGKERGAALLTVLLLVAVIAILAAHGIDRLAGATKLASNARELSQAKAYLIAAEAIGIRSAEQIVSASPGRTINVDGWNGREQKFPVPGGIITASLADGGNCFNINSLVTQQQATLSARPEGLAQFSR